MFTRSMSTSVAAVLIAAAFSGCPQANSGAVGAWAIYLDYDCNDNDISAYMVLLHANHSAELLASQAYEGTWNIVGSTIAITFTDIGGSQFIFTGTYENDIITDGAFSVDDAATGCISALRIVT